MTKPRGIMTALVVVNVGIAAVVSFNPSVRRGLADFVAWIQEIGPAGHLIMLAAFIPATLLFIPPVILKIGAGYVFGVFEGFLIGAFGTAIGGACAFLTGRTILRDRMRRWMDRNPDLRAIDQAVGGREGFKIVFLCRLSPIMPFSAIHYALGATRMSFWSFFLASLLGGLPLSLAYAYIGAALQSFAEFASGQGATGTLRIVLTGVGVVATIALSIVVARAAKRAIARAGTATTTG